VGLSDIRTRIKGLLLGVDGIEIVHEYRRYASNWGKLLELFKTDGGIIHGWMISRSGVGSERHNSKMCDRNHTVTLTGIYGLDDAGGSELVFQRIIEDLLDAVETDKTLGKTVQECSPAKTAIIETRMFGNVLCHYAELVVSVTEIVTPTS